MTSDERIRTLRRFGYNDHEAAFLTLVALHSGYFLRRQYNRFLGQTRGRPDAELVRKVLENRHAKREPTAQNAQVCHLHSHALYRAIGQADNRHRRDRAPLAVKAKLMGLDFVLAHRGVSYLATEQEKLAYFHGSRGIDLARLPQKTYRSRQSGPPTARYFIEKYPIFLSAKQGGREPVASFCYVDEGVLSTSGFESFLARYRSMFEELGRVRLVYIAHSVKLLPAASRKFERFLRKLNSGGQGRTGTNRNELREYFELRRRYEAKEFAELDKQKLDRLSRYMRRFAGRENDRKFEAWRSVDPEARCASRPTATGSRPLRAEFSTFRLRHNYDLFGAAE